jgi:uncharacterized protein YdeI (YjbR/CyaY-like superfamily)
MTHRWERLQPRSESIRGLSRSHKSIGAISTSKPVTSMGTRDPRVDAYIARQADFARPILDHLREVIHAACPEVEETLKWSRPHFMYHGMLGGMSAFKQHAAFGFWKGSLIVDPAGKPVDEAMGQFGRLTRLSDLPSAKVLAGYVKKAMKLNEAGIKPARAKQSKPALVVPDYFQAALKKNKKAGANFERFSPSMRREYVEWVDEAKRDQTRLRRLATALEWLAEGKSRNWKYEDC